LNTLPRATFFPFYELTALRRTTVFPNPKLARKPTDLLSL
jgi:hypothetical protein